MSTKGTYIIVLFIKKGVKLQIGKLGSFDFKRGYYAYVGSAFGPGGLAARLKHHQTLSARPHWHIDYLKTAAALVDIWYSTQPDRSEHTWAEKLLNLEAGQCPVKGFGSSDCHCLSHLVYFERKPTNEMLARVLSGTVHQKRASKRQPALDPLPNLQDS